MLRNEAIAPSLVFGQVLRRHRVAMGWSQERLGLEADVQRNFISLIETGQNQPTITTLFKLASALKLTPSTLIVETERIVLSANSSAAVIK